MEQVKQTSVEWLIDELDYETISKFNFKLEKAKAIEKEQIIDAWLSAWKDSMLNPLEDKYYQPEAEQYYKEKYGK